MPPAGLSTRAGQLLIDREGIVRWAYVERVDAAFAIEPEVLAAARALRRLTSPRLR